MGEDNGRGTGRGRRPYRPLAVVLVLFGIFGVYAASDGWHLSCHLLDAKCVRVLGLNFGQSITANAQLNTQSSDTSTDTTTETTTETSTTETSTAVNGIPSESPGNPIKVDCPLNASTGAVENSQSPTSCFWVVGPGTGAEQNPPPNPRAGAQYNPDQGEVCIWRDAGKDDTGTGEVFVCEYPP